MTDNAAAGRPDQHLHRLTATVTGAVQGVGFRYWTRREAEALGVAGSAANQADGSVLVLAEGPRPALEALLEALQSPRTPGTVAQVRADFGPAEGHFRGFREE